MDFVNNDIYRSKYITIGLTLLSFIIIAFGFYFVSFGFDVNDEAYQTLNAINPTVNPQAVLASYISNIYGRIFGFSLYSMRVLIFGINILSIGAAVGYYYSNGKNINRALTLFILLICVSLCVPVKSRLIGWDCFAILFTTLSLIMMVKLWKRIKLSEIIYLGVLTACATLSRIPDIIIVPIAILSILYSSKKENRWSSLLCYLISFSIACVAILAIIYHGDIIKWVIDLKSNFVSGHSTARLVQAYLHTGKFDLIDILLLSVVLFVGRKYIENQKISIMLYSIFFILVSSLMCIKLDRVHYPVNRLLTSIVILFLFTYITTSEKRQKKGYIIRSIIILGCCLVPMAGSDGGTHKFMNISAIPIILSLLPSLPYKKLPRLDKSYIAMVWVILCAAAVIMPLFTATHSVFDGGWHNARIKVDHNLLENNTTTSERAETINEMLLEGKRVLPETFLIIGHNNRRFFSEYLWGQRNELWPHDWGDNILEDKDKINLLLEKIYAGEISDIVFVKYGANEFSNFEENPMRTAIESTGLYDCNDFKWFVVCTKNPNKTRREETSTATAVE